MNFHCNRSKNNFVVLQPIETNMEKLNLVNRLINNEKSALNELYAEYSPKLYRFAFGYLKSEAEALDIVQEVFINIWNYRNKLNKQTNLDSLMFTVAKNTIVSVFRKKLSEKEFLEYLKHKVINNSIDAESQISYNLLKEEVEKLIEQLPPQRKKIYELSKQNGLTNKAIAAELNISVKTVEDHITKARKFLKDNLNEYGFLAILFIELFVF